MSPQGTERLARVGALLRAWPRSALGLWRRSLRLRVVTAIVVLSALVVGSVGWLVMRQITDGLVQSRVDASVAEARTETATARERLGSAGGNDFDPDTQLRLLVENLVARGEVKGFDVVVLGPVGDGGTTGGVRTTPAVDTASVPTRLRSERGEWRGRPRLDLHPDPLQRQHDPAHGPARRRRRLDRRAPLGRRHLRALLPVPDGGGAADAAPGPSGAADSGRAPPPARGRGRGAGDAAGDHPGAARPPGRGADRLGPARGADARPRRGRHRPPRDVVQPDGRGVAVPDPQAGGALPGAADASSPTSPTSCARRSRRCAWPATCCTTPGRASTPSPPARPSCCRTSSTGSRTCWATCSRSAASTRARPCSSSRTPTSATSCTGWSAASPRWHCSEACRSRSSTRACSWPRSTYAGSSGSCATC